MDKYINKQDIIIDSDNRISGTHGNFLIKLNIKNPDVDQIVIKDISIKKGWFTVNADTNTFTLIENGVQIPITYDVGNYNVDSFRFVTINKLNAATLNGWVYNITFPNAYKEPNTGYYTFTCTGGNPSFKFTNGLYEQFGFSENTTNTFVGGSLKSTTTVFFQAADFIRVISNITDSTSNTSNNVLLSLGSAVPDFTSMNYVCPDLEAYSLPYAGTLEAQFAIMDKHFHLLEAEHVTMTVTLYKKNTFADQANKIILMSAMKQYFTDPTQK